MENSILKKINYGMYIVTTNYLNEYAGCVINTLTQITSESNIFSISINKNNYTNIILKKGKKLAVSILSTDTTKDSISTFGYYSSNNVDKFSNIEYDLINNLPIIKDNICGYLIGDIIDIIDVQTHDIFLFKANDMVLLNDIEAMSYTYYQNKLKGISPKNAPTYINETFSNSKAKKYRCIICGHIYDEDVEKIPFDNLPDDWKCPVCGVSKDKFELLN